MNKHLLDKDNNLPFRTVRVIIAAMGHHLPVLSSFLLCHVSTQGSGNAVS